MLQVLLDYYILFILQVVLGEQSCRGTFEFQLILFVHFGVLEVL